MSDYSHKYQHREKRYIVLYSIPKKFDLSKTSVLLCFKPFRIWCFNMTPKKKNWKFLFFLFQHSTCRTAWYLGQRKKGEQVRIWQLPPHRETTPIRHMGTHCAALLIERREIVHSTQIYFRTRNITHFSDIIIYSPF